MAKNWDEIILKDIEKKFDDALNEFAEEMTFRIESIYESAIQDFYRDYNPRSYNRTYSTYLGSDKYDNPFDYENLGDFFVSGILVDATNIPGKPYRADTDWVFDRTFIHGIHGFNLRDLHQKEELDNMAEWVAFGTIRGKKRNWKNYLKRINSGIEKYQNYDAPKNLSPPPKKRVDKAFKQLTKKKNMDSIFDDIFKKHFS